MIFFSFLKNFLVFHVQVDLEHIIKSIITGILFLFEIKKNLRNKFTEQDLSVFELMKSLLNYIC